MNTNMSSKKFALIGGTIMLGLGLIALIPALSVYTQSLPKLYVESSYGYFLGIFPTNIFNKIALIVFGIAGLMCSNASLFGVNVLSELNEKNDDPRPSIIWSRAVFYAMGALAILGMFQQTNTLGGYWPLFGNEVWFHALFAVIGGYFGYIVHEEPTRSSGSNLHRA